LRRLDSVEEYRKYKGEDAAVENHLLCRAAKKDSGIPWKIGSKVEKLSSLKRWPPQERESVWMKPLR